MRKLLNLLSFKKVKEEGLKLPSEGNFEDITGNEELLISIVGGVYVSKEGD